MKLPDLPPASRVGVDGDAREAAVRRLRPDLEVVRAMGPLEERAARVQSGELHGLVVALVAVRRAGLHSAVGEVFSVTDVLPAAAQAATAVEILELEAELGTLLNRVDHLASRWCVTAERDFERALAGAGALCVGAHAEVRDMNIHLRGRAVWRGALTQGAVLAPVDALEGLGGGLAEQLLRGEGAGV
jgi:hydroxymethylbilane synthase